jgi:hypothetical protein
MICFIAFKKKIDLDVLEVIIRSACLELYLGTKP